MYTLEQVLNMIDKAFWAGVEEGKDDDAGEYFVAADYLEEPMKPTKKSECEHKRIISNAWINTCMDCGKIWQGELTTSKTQEEKPVEKSHNFCYKCGFCSEFKDKEQHKLVHELWFKQNKKHSVTALHYHEPQKEECTCVEDNKLAQALCKKHNPQNSREPQKETPEWEDISKRHKDDAILSVAFDEFNNYLPKSRAREEIGDERLFRAFKASAGAIRFALVKDILGKWPKIATESDFLDNDAPISSENKKIARLFRDVRNNTLEEIRTLIENS